MTTCSCFVPNLRLKVAGLLMLLPVIFMGMEFPCTAQGPQWWTTRGVWTNMPATNDYAPANAGQLKHMAWQAYAEMEAKLPGGAGAEISNLMNGVTSGGDFSPINIGQLKYTARPFYNRLVSLGLTNVCSWYVVGGLRNHAPVNVGQLKNAFCFDYGDDSDADGMPDWWEEQHGLNPTSGICVSLTGWWRLDDGGGTCAVNSAIGAYNGELINVSNTLNSGWSVDGKMGGALRLDGEDDWIRIAQSPNIISGGAFTVSAWVWLDSSCTSDWPEVMSDLNPSTWDGLCLGFNSTDHAYAMVGPYGWIQDTNAAADQWVWIAMEYDGSHLRLYRDGELIGAPVATSYIPSSNGIFAIGNGQDPGSREFWRGMIDDVRVYREAIGINGLAGLYDAWDDLDGDGLCNLDEYSAGTAPDIIDTDEDGMPDGWEYQNEMDPLWSNIDHDDDLDGWTDLEEYQASTDPTQSISHPDNCWYVATNGTDVATGGGITNPFATLTNAISFAEDGGRIIVLPGTFTGVGNRSVNLDGKSVYFTGVAGHRDDTVLNCDYAGRAFEVNPGEGLTLRHLTIRNGCSGAGGAVAAGSTAGSIALISCTFSSNRADIGGAVWGCAPMSIQNCRFEGNSATNSGGAVHSTNAMILSNCVFTGNSAISGGAIMGKKQATLLACGFAENTAGEEGGALTYEGAPDGIMRVSECSFEYNSAASGRGGAVYIIGSPMISPTVAVDRCRFLGNHSASGGAIETLLPCIASISLFKSNRASLGGAILADKDLLLRNCTVVENEALDTGSEGAIMNVYGSATLSIVNTIIWSNSCPVTYLDNPGDHPLVFSNCCVQDGMNIPIWHQTFYLDPAFETDGWHLASNSPCISAGQYLEGMSTTTDLDGQHRIQGVIDIGADERWDNETDPGERDGDIDGMSDLYEELVGLDPAIPNIGVDSDGDGVTDCDEIGMYHSNPLADDSDNDGLDDKSETLIGTDPASGDTDGDDMLDGWETVYNLNPLLDRSGGGTTKDGQIDADGDGIGLQAEILLDLLPDVYDDPIEPKLWGTTDAGETSMEIVCPPQPCQ